MNLSAWAPSLIAVISALLMLGAYFNTLNRHEKDIMELKTTVGAHGISIAELKAWRDGYNAAVAKYRPEHQTIES